MEILLISRCPPFPLYRGDRLIPYYLARELAARHHLIDLLAFYDQPDDIAQVPRYERLFRSVSLLREPRRPALSYARRALRRQARFPAHAAESWAPEMWRTIAATLRDRAYDVVHLFGGVQVYEYLPLVRALPNVIVPYEAYSLWLDRALQQPASLPARAVLHARRWMARHYESWMFEGYDRAVVLTDQDARALKALNPLTPVVVIPNGVDVDHFTPTGYEPDEPTLLFIGNYDYLPNCDAALRLARALFPRIKARVPQARLVLVGGQVPRELRACASEGVEITGRVPDVRPYFEQAMVFVSPLRLGAGIKNKVLEAMAMGVPVVATPLSCDGMPVAHEQQVMLGTTDDELVDSVLRVLGDADLRRRLRLSARQVIEEHFTWQRVAEQYEDLYRQVIRERRERALARTT